MRRFVYYNAASVGVVLDPDAEAFLLATGITDSTITSAINTLVVDLKFNNLWSKFRFIYPFVGGTANTNKFNLKDPQDTNSAFRLQFFGGITHTNGFNPNGTNGYADTFCVPSTNVTLNNEHLCLVSNTNNTPSTNDSIDFGSFISITQASTLSIRNGSLKNTLISRMNGAVISSINVDAIGVFMASKKSTTTLSIYKNASLINSGSSSGTLPNLSVFIGNARVSAGPYNIGYTNQNYTFATYGDGLDASEVSQLTTLINNFNTTLGR